jgi:rod shape-determining protein MreC
MRRIAYKKYLFLGLALFALLSLPLKTVNRLRGATLAFFTSFWNHSLFNSPIRLQATESERCRLETENHLLRLEIGKLRTIIEQEHELASLLKEMKLYGALDRVRRYEELNFLSEMMIQCIPARVIYRDPSIWYSSFWVNAGEETNEKEKMQIIVKNSPVILGRSVVGAIDYVGKKQSRVRLITDLGINPSVRAVRGMPQNAHLLDSVEGLLRSLNSRKDLSLSKEEERALSSILEKMKKMLAAPLENWQLGKGILHGSGSALWRTRVPLLKGSGFNYDFADQEGPARDLLTGKPLDNSSDFPAMPLIKVNDLLVTTGMDGVFPPGLKVAEVTKVYPLREGAYTYDIEALPTVCQWDGLHTVFIIPPLGYNPEFP